MPLDEVELLVVRDPEDLARDRRPDNLVSGREALKLVGDLHHADTQLRAEYIPNHSWL